VGYADYRDTTKGILMSQVPTTDTDRARDYLVANSHKSQFLASVLNYWERHGVITEKQLSAVLSGKRASVNPVTEVGMYRNSQGVFRVKQSKRGSFYAMRFVPEASTKSERFVYEAGAIYELSASDRMTIEQAQEIGALAGVCCVCGADLTNEKSVRAGIGSVCAKRV
jgi:hypothetical protein